MTNAGKTKYRTGKDPYRWSWGKSRSFLKIRQYFAVLIKKLDFYGTIGLPICLEQWFSTGVPLHIRVPLDDVRGAAKYHFYWSFDLFKHLGVPPKIYLAHQGCREVKKVEKHWPRIRKIQTSFKKLKVEKGVNFLYDWICCFRQNTVKLKWRRYGSNNCNANIWESIFC